MILSIDFDGTLCYNSWPDVSNSKQAWIHKLICWYVRNMARKGWQITLNTLREDPPMKETYYLSDAIVYARERGIEFDYINENPDWMTEKYGPSRKVSADRYLDDRNIGFLGWILRRYEK